MDFLAFSDSDGVVPSAISITAEAPWLCAANTATDSDTTPLIELHNEILALCDFVSPSESDMKVRTDLVAELEKIAHEVFPECSVHVFGSQMTNILTPTSDLDLVWTIFIPH